MAVANAFLSLTLRRSRVSDVDFTPQISLHEPFKIFPIRHGFLESGLTFSRKKDILHASTNGTGAVGSASLNTDQDADYVPMPMVLIDQDSDSDATIVQLSFGDRLGALIDTMKALKDLGLDVSKGTVTTEGSITQTKFFITRFAHNNSNL